MPLSLEGWHYEIKKIWEVNSWSHPGLMTRVGSRLGMPGYWLLARHKMCLVRMGKGFAQGLSNRALNKMELQQDRHR